ncbi:GNAT family N-acetyltransferase [Pseudofrankia sp. DC12]|uniref:GNAT family N-acetyltransferase n=1 Tax=Pseudofrankia sp. DC12 TaxID=683315 RepID=UPI0005F89638|nr:GNAT family N-acetyltransferase [Pseudofrankia sp. DC12]
MNDGGAVWRDVVNRVRRLARSTRSAARRGQVRGPQPTDWAVVRLDAADWRPFRRVRLRSLDRSGRHLGGELDAERRFRKSDWQDRTRAETWLAVRHPNPLLRAHLIVGVAALNRAEQCDRLDGRPHPHIESIWVSPRWQRKGIASALTTEIVNSAGVPEIGLWVFDGNDRAQNLFSRLGFAGDGSMQLFKDGRRKETHMSMEVKRQDSVERRGLEVDDRFRPSERIPPPRRSAGSAGVSNTTAHSPAGAPLYP